MQNKKTNITFIIISILTVVVTLVGLTFAFLTTSITGTNATIGVQAEGNLGNIVFNGGADFQTSSDIEPGWSETKTITLTVPAAKAQEMYIKLDYTNNMPELEYKFELTNIMVGSTNAGTSSSYVTNDFSGNGLSITSTGTNFITFNSSNTPQTLTLTQVNTGAYDGTITITYQLTLRLPETNVNQNQNQGKLFTGSLYAQLNNETIYYNNENQSGTGSQPMPPTLLVDKLLELNPTRLTRASFSSVLTTDNTGTLYTTTNTEDGSTVYYFAGNALNNWVKFGKCTSSDYNCTVGDDLYWRIIRTNETIEDGGIRLLYAGSGSVANQNAYIGSSAYNTDSDNPMYVGYMWGTTGSLANNRTNQTNKSNAATTISSWYTATFNNNSDNNTKDSGGNLLTNYISPTAIYCNDRSVGSGTYNSDTSFNYGAITRLNTNKAPSLACGANTSGYGNYFEGTSSIADKFTGSAKNSSNVTIGNGLLGTTPAALITADEIAFAGGKYNTRASAWYYYNAASTAGSITGTKLWWTLSPDYWSGSYALVFDVNGSDDPGRLGNIYVSNASGVLRPVVSLKSDILWSSGDGSSTSPFEVTLAG